MLVKHDTNASAHLDAVRIGAALAVFASHSRNLFFLDYPLLAATDAQRGPLVQLFYFATGLGHQAVIVFFVLSGLFIGQTVQARHAPGRHWSWPDYLIDRVSRLHIVLMPALFLTVVFDLLGMTMMPELYAGSVGNVVAPDVSARHGLINFLMNAFYLQTILGPTFGSNGALWSLANEFWYYVIFPLGLRAMVAPRTKERVTALATGAAAVWLVGGNILMYFPIWLMGALILVLPRVELRPKWGKLLHGVSAMGVFAALAVARVHSGVFSDYLLGATVAAWVYATTRLPEANSRTSSRAARTAKTLAAFSFTLYAVHLPLVIALRALVGSLGMGTARARPELSSVALFVVLLLVGGLFAWTIAQFTEAHTDGLRRRMRRAAGTSPAPSVES